MVAGSARNSGTAPHWRRACNPYFERVQRCAAEIPGVQYRIVCTCCRRYAGENPTAVEITRTCRARRRSRKYDARRCTRCVHRNVVDIVQRNEERERPLLADSAGRNVIRREHRRTARRRGNKSYRTVNAAGPRRKHDGVPASRTIGVSKRLLRRAAGACGYISSAPANRLRN